MPHSNASSAGDLVRCLDLDEFDLRLDRYRLIQPKADQLIYQRRLQSIASRYDTDDLFSDVQLSALRDWDKRTSTDMAGVRKWVRVIAKNTTITMLDRHIGCGKRSVKREVMGSRGAEFNECPELQQCATCEAVDQVDLEELLQKCRNVVDALPSRQAKAVQLRYLDDVNYEVVATELAVSVGAARTLVSRGIATCREQAGQYSDENLKGTNWK